MLFVNDLHGEEQEVVHVKYGPFLLWRTKSSRVVERVVAEQNSIVSWRTYTSEFLNT